MWALIKGNIKYILRARLIFLLLAFSFLIHIVGMKMVNHLTVSVQGMVSVLGGKEAIFISLFLQLFTGVFLVAVYGIWMAPYAHRGERSVLTYILPVARWKFPLCYALCCLGLLLINQLVMFLSYGSVFGWSALAFSEFPWGRVLASLALEILALEVLMLWLTVSSLSIGQVPTFFLGGMGMFILQVLGSFARFNGGNGDEPLFSTWNMVLTIYRKLPPVGDLIFDLKELFQLGQIHWERLILWGIWFGVFVLLFHVKLRFPLKMRSTES